MTERADKKTGSCLCSAVQFEVTGPLRDIMMCHCIQCQKSSGHHFAATAAATSDLHITENGSLKWFKSSHYAERGFCADCGSNLFWRMPGRDTISILAGSFDGDINLPVSSHIFVGAKKSYYSLDPDVVQYEAYPKG